MKLICKTLIKISFIILAILIGQTEVSFAFANDNSTLQDKITIKGIVKDEQGETITGASVFIKGTGIGTTTDSEGKYTLSIPGKTEKLSFSFIGMTTTEVAIGTNREINVKLKLDAISLDEVVSIGYGVKTKATTTGAVSVINDEIFQSKPISNTTGFLQGVIPGVEVKRYNAGQVGEDSYSIQIRGITSRSDPGILVVVDGIPYKDNNANALNQINPQDIENITVLKDAQAAIYGARAAGGVILVTTKKGKESRPTVTFSGDLSIVSPSKIPQKVNILNHIEMMNEAYLNDGIQNHQFSHLVPYINTADIYSDNPQVVKGVFGDTPDLVLGWHDWWKEMYGNAFDQSYTLTVSGRSEKSNYYTSVGYLDQNSMLNYGNNYNKRYFGRFKYDYKVNDYLKLRTNIYVGTKKTVEPSEMGQLSWLTYWTWNCQPTYNPAGEYYGAGGFGNPVAFAENIGDRTKNYNSYYTQLGFDLTPLKNLTITGDFSLNYDMRDESYARKDHKTYHWDGSLNYDVIDYWYSGKTKAGSVFDKSSQVVASIYGTYKFDLSKNHFDVMFGGSHEELDNHGFNAHRYNLLTDKLNVMSLGSSDQQYNGDYKNQWAIESVFGRLSYNYDYRYFLEATYRDDGSSRFAPGQKWKSFWGVSGSWALSNEKFFDPVKKYVNYAKLRLSWGQLGNQAGIGLYDFAQYIYIGGLYPFGNSDSPSKSMQATTGGMPAINRTWETIDITNAGVDFYVLNSRLGITADYYIKDNKGMFYTEEYPSVLGVAAPSINGAHLRTKGWEVALNWKDKIGKVGYHVGASLSDNNSEVIKLSDSRSPGYGLNSFVEGYPSNSYFVYEFDGFMNSKTDLDNYLSKVKGVPSNLRVGDAKYVDKNGNGTLEPFLYKEGDPNSGDMVYVGTANQRYLYGIEIGAEYKGVDFRLFGQGVGKWLVMNNTYAGGVEVWKQASQYFYHNTWSEDRQGAMYPRLTQDGGINGYNYQQSNAPHKLVNNRYFRVKDLQVGYTFPKEFTKKILIEKLRVYLSGTNLFEFDQLPDGFDPEVPYTESLIPFTRTYAFGLNVTF